MTIGIPQELVPGPLQSVGYINNVDENVQGRISPFADDTKVGGSKTLISWQVD